MPIEEIIKPPCNVNERDRRPVGARYASAEHKRLGELVSDLDRQHPVRPRVNAEHFDRELHHKWMRSHELPIDLDRPGGQRLIQRLRYLRVTVVCITDLDRERVLALDQEAMRCT